MENKKNNGGLVAVAGGGLLLWWLLSRKGEQQAQQPGPGATNAVWSVIQTVSTDDVVSAANQFEVLPLVAGGQ